jgi:deazaflavin-dependent oxidoreductase (nitroreductase family)
MPWQRLYNPFVIVLRSSLHGFMGRSTLLLTYTGRKSGKAYTLPVNYLRDGDTLLVVSSCEHIWWKNLRGGAPVAVRVRG